MPPSFFDTLMQAPIVPTVFPFSADTLCGYARALHEEGFPMLEILSRPPEEGMRVFREIGQRPERHLIQWGLGTILTESIARRAVELRPDFLVSPAFSRRVLHVAAEAGIPYIPGVCSFQDVQDVLESFEEEGLSLQILKLCPVDGLSEDYVRMLAGCYPNIVFCPTGEVTLENLSYWTQFPHITAPMGSGFVPDTLLAAQDFHAVRLRLCAIRERADLGRNGNGALAVTATHALRERES